METDWIWDSLAESGRATVKLAYSSIDSTAHALYNLKDQLHTEAVEEGVSLRIKADYTDYYTPTLYVYLRRFS